MTLKVPGAGPLHLKSLGSPDLARDVLARYHALSPAYRRHLASEVGREVPDPGALDWNRIPLLTKKNFYGVFPAGELIPEENRDLISGYLRSSGSTSPDGTNIGFFWPQMKSTTSPAVGVWQGRIIESFQLQRRRTLAIIGMSLGSWSGGDRINFMFKNMALRQDLALAVFSPGNVHAEILEIIQRFHGFYEQLIIALCPSAIFYLERLAEKLKVPLPYEKISFLVAGEGFAEEARLAIQRKRGVPGIAMLSHYASADTDLLGLESAELGRVRQHLAANPATARELGFKSRSMPNLLHHMGTMGYLEDVDGDLVVTKWQGMPLVRYNLNDSIQFYSWKTLCGELAVRDEAGRKDWAAMAELDRPDVIAIYGRSDACVFLCGSNIFATMLEEVVMQSSLAAISTGAFVAWIRPIGSRQVLAFQIELKEGRPEPAGTRLEEIHAEFVRLLSLQQPEFAGDYKLFYEPFEREGLRIFEFHFTAAPGLSGNSRYNSKIKRKVIVDHGPI